MLLRTVPMYISLRLASTEECSEYTQSSTVPTYLKLNICSTSSDCFTPCEWVAEKTSINHKQVAASMRLLVLKRNFWQQGRAVLQRTTIHYVQKASIGNFTDGGIVLKCGASTVQKFAHVSLSIPNLSNNFRSQRTCRELIVFEAYYTSIIGNKYYKELKQCV